ncbi:Gfo/Idh/MocA family oxidoreductase [bacterium]|nr:Gfo/Idh/MocA family oxidoreductase [bacterium]
MQENQKVRVGVIGAGGITQVSHIPNLSSVEAVDLVAVCDSEVARAVSIADRFGVSEWYDDPEVMLKKSDLDCVVIATPTITHLPLCQMALEREVDVMVEKPFARNSDEAKRIIHFAEKNEKLLMVGMNHRFREDVAFLKEIINTGDLGEYFMVRSGWLKRLGVWGRPYWFMDPTLAGGGVLIDLGLQMIDLVLYLLDQRTVVEGTCGLSNKMLDLEVEDTASIFLRFDDDTTLLLEVSWANCETDDKAYTFISGAQGSASLNPLRINSRWGDRVMTETAPVLADGVELYRQSFRTEIIHFIDCVQNRREPLSSGRDALASIEIVDKLYAASEGI